MGDREAEDSRLAALADPTVNVDGHAEADRTVELHLLTDDPDLHDAVELAADRCASTSGLEAYGSEDALLGGLLERIRLHAERWETAHVAIVDPDAGDREVLELLDAIKGPEHLRRTPVLSFPPREGSPSMRELYNHQVNYVIPRPNDREEIARVFEQALRFLVRVAQLP